MQHFPVRCAAMTGPQVLAQCGRTIGEVVEGRSACNERLEQTLQRLAADLVSLATGSEESRNRFLWAMAEPEGGGSSGYSSAREALMEKRPKVQRLQPEDGCALSNYNLPPGNLSGTRGQWPIGGRIR